MRHLRKIKKFNRNSHQRKALFGGLVQSLLAHGTIITTISKGKAIKKIADSLINKALKNDLNARRQIIAYLPNKKTASKLYDKIAPEFTRVNGSYTRLIRTGPRRGDGTVMAKIELIKKAVEKKPAEKIK